MYSTHCTGIILNSTSKYKKFFLIEFIRNKVKKTLQVNRNRKIFIVAVIKATSSVVFITRKNWDLGSIFSYETVRSASVRLPWKFFCFYSLFVHPIKETSSVALLNETRKSDAACFLCYIQKSHFTDSDNFISKWERLFSIAWVISAIMADITGKIEILGSIFSHETVRSAGVQCYF